VTFIFCSRQRTADRPPTR